MRVECFRLGWQAGIGSRVPGAETGIETWTGMGTEMSFCNHWAVRLDLLLSHPISSYNESYGDPFNSSILQWGVKVHDTKAWTQPLCEERRTFHCSWHGVPYILYNHTMKYCLNQPNSLESIAARKCHLQYLPSILLGKSLSSTGLTLSKLLAYLLFCPIVVALLNAFKSICILLVIFVRRDPTFYSGWCHCKHSRNDRPTYKKAWCNLQNEIVEYGTRWSKFRGNSQVWDPHPTRWYFSASRRRWILTMTW